MSERGVEDAVREIVGRHRRLREGPLEDRQSLAGDLGFDSLAFLMLLTDLEQAFGLDFPVERIDELRDLTVAGLVRLVHERVRHAAETT